MVGFDSHAMLLATCQTYRKLWASQTVLVNDPPGVAPLEPEAVDV